MSGAPARLPASKIIETGRVMAERQLRQSALAHLGLEARALEAPAEAGISMCERGFRDQLALRGNVGDKAFVAAVEQVLGVAPPAQANTVATHRGITLLWLGPDEWLVTLPDGRGAKALAALEEALAGQHFLVSDVSCSRTVIGLAGEHARDVLSKGCSLDLHPREFGPGRCAQSVLARCHMLLHQLDDTPTYDVYVHRSFADYAWTWLEDAGAEYGVAVAGAG